MQTTPFYLTEGDRLDQPIRFNAASYRVDNPTNGWVKINGEYRVGPLGFGYVTVVKPAISQATMEVTLTDPGGATATGNGQVCSILWFDTEQDPCPASYQTITASIVATLTTLEQIRSAAGAATDVGYQATDLTIPVSLRDGSAGNSGILGTAAAPIRNDPTGTTRQPVNLNQVGGAAYALGQAAMAASAPVVIASNQTSLPTTEARAATSVVTSVNDSNVNQTLKAANASRLGIRIYNNSDQVLYVKYGATATTTDFTVALAAALGGQPGGYLEETQYTGIIDGIWAANSTGAALITELTA